MTSTERIHEFVAPQRRGLLALPANLRARLRLDQPGAQVEFVELDDGRIEVRGVVPVPADQAWFWTNRWQEMEREVDQHLAAGRVSHHESVDDLLDALGE